MVNACISSSPSQLSLNIRQRLILPSSSKMRRQQLPQQQQFNVQPPSPTSSMISDCPSINSMANPASTITTRDHRLTHKEIEKRRRDKLNLYINDLASMIPTCSGSGRKLDKVTVLRLTLQHLQSLPNGGAGPCGGTERYKRPSQLTDGELRQLILPHDTSSNTESPLSDLSLVEKCFLFVIDSDGGRILYVSQTVGTALGYVQSDLCGQSLFDLLHPNDITKVKEQMSPLDQSVSTMVRERLIDTKTILPKFLYINDKQRLFVYLIAWCSRRW